MQGKPKHTVMSVPAQCQAPALDAARGAGVLQEMGSQENGDGMFVTKPWCHWSPPPHPQSQSEPAQGVLAAAHHVLQVVGRAEMAVVTPGDSVGFSRVTAVAKGHPQPSTPLPWEH